MNTGLGLNGKVAIVTGSSRGIGAATVKLLAQHGARVTVNCKVNREAGAKVLADIEKIGGKGILIQADVTEPDQVKTLIEKTEQELGPIDILVNNANMSFPVRPFVEFDWRGFEQKLLHEMKGFLHRQFITFPVRFQRI